MNMIGVKKIAPPSVPSVILYVFVWMFFVEVFSMSYKYKTGTCPTKICFDSR